jgi:hypothetical protein
MSRRHPAVHLHWPWSYRARGRAVVPPKTRIVVFSTDCMMEIWLGEALLPLSYTELLTCLEMQSGSEFNKPQTP